MSQVFKIIVFVRVLKVIKPLNQKKLTAFTNTGSLIVRLLESTHQSIVKHIFQSFLKWVKIRKWLIISTWFIKLHTCVNAEHSRYFWALVSFANRSACSCVIGLCLLFASFSMIFWSSRKSLCVPTRIKGVPGQWKFISETHWDE